MEAKKFYLTDVTRLYATVSKSKTPLVDVLATMLFAVQDHSTCFLLPGNWTRHRVKETLFKFDTLELVQVGELADEFNRNRKTINECFATELGRQSYFRKVKVGDVEKVYLVYPKLEIKKKEANLVRGSLF